MTLGRTEWTNNLLKLLIVLTEISKALSFLNIEGLVWASKFTLKYIIFYFYQINKQN